MKKLNKEELKKVSGAVRPRPCCANRCVSRGLTFPGRRIACIQTRKI
jgi:hypothetical protein